MHDSPIPSSNPDIPSQQRPRELAMSAAWNAGLTRAVSAIDGQEISIIFGGHWTHGFGPDFSDAMLNFSRDGTQSGSVEIHTRASDWYAHGHHLDERYNEVVLHIVTVNDVAETRRADGKIVPVALLAIPDDVLFAIDRQLPDIWAELGGSVCAAGLSKREPARIRIALHRLGDLRLADKVTSIEGLLADVRPENLFLEMVFEGFGYSENRGPMRQLAQTMLRYDLSSSLSFRGSQSPPPELLGIMLGISGFLPFSPSDAWAGGILPEDQYRIERHWLASPASFAADTIPATAWHMGRVRPANHPVARIMQAGTLMVKTDSQPMPQALDAIRNQECLVELLREWTTRPGHPGLGRGRSTAIVASVIIPFALAVAIQQEDADLEDAARRTWTSLRHAEWTRPGKRALRQVTGGSSIRGLGERGHQGLLHLDKALCTPRRCFECPIAADVVRDRTAGGHHEKT